MYNEFKAEIRGGAAGTAMTYSVIFIIFKMSMEVHQA
jgi:hypothetical protein